ncbi:MAG: hypothetical protein HQ556_00275 [Candidatus Marinimicrobia bacterium]|nr:hypothetical protein [Candidatus Neomarinimicrobiota bacterium]
MSFSYQWEHNPARKYFEILLAVFWGYPLVMHKSYQYKTFGREERAYLRTEIEKLPLCPLRELLLSILKVVQPPTGSFKIKSFKLQEDGDKLVHTHEIMADPHVFFRVAGLAWLNVNSVEIFTNLKHHSIQMIYKEKHIARFLYQYWNVRTQLGFSAKSRTALIYHMRASDNLLRTFKLLVKGAWSDLTPLELAKIYDIPLHHGQIRALNSQTIQNGRLALFADSKEIKTTDSEHISTKFLESTLKMQSGLNDHDDREENGSDPGDLLSFGGIGEADE